METNIIKGKGYRATYTAGAYFNWIITDTIKKENIGFYNKTNGYSWGDDAFHPLGSDGITLDRLQDLITLCTKCSEYERNLK